MVISNEELSAYIKKRRELYGFSNTFKSSKKVNSEGNFFDKLNFFKNLSKKEKNVVKLSPEIKEADEMINEIDTTKKTDDQSVVSETKTVPVRMGFIEKIKGVFVKKQDKIYIEETIEEDAVELDYEEIRQAFRIANSLIKKLPPAVLKAFKESDSYPVYVNTMRKLKLVKEKTSEDEQEQ